MTAPTATIVIVTYNSEEVLPKALAGIGNDFPIVVVDNASTDETVAIAEQAGATIIRNSSNMGFGCGCNMGAQAVETDHILFMNPDVEFPSNAIHILLDKAKERPDGQAFGPRLTEHDGTELYRWTNFIHGTSGPRPEAAPEKTSPVMLLSGAIFLIRKQVFDRLGGFDENMFLFFEEDDLFKRLTDEGGVIYYVPEVEAIHTSGRSAPRTFQREIFRNLHYGWSQCYVAKKHGIEYDMKKDRRTHLRRLIVGILTLNRKRIAINLGRMRGISAWLAGKSAPNL